LHGSWQEVGELLKGISLEVLDAVRSTDTSGVVVLRELAFRNGDVGAIVLGVYRIVAHVTVLEHVFNRLLVAYSVLVLGGRIFSPQLEIRRGTL
jgi:hypothetical protein